MRNFENRRHPDISRSVTTPASVGSRVESLLKIADKFQNVQELKNEFIKIIDNDQISISKAKNLEYKDRLKRIYTLFAMREFIKNVYISAANLSVIQLKRR